MNRNRFFGGAVVSLLLALASVASASAPTGAIFTTVKDGSEVNYNHYASKLDVYLDGGPGPGAPQSAAALDDGRYVFQVTDPSGKTLLSTDKARSRQFDVVAGIIHNVVAQADHSEHQTGLDVDYGAATVQLFPYNDTPNHGGVYKVWVTKVEDFVAGCAKLGVTDGLERVDAGFKPGNAHGFIPADSKTDNFKVKDVAIVEIDTRFYDAATGNILDGLGITWVDPLGCSNEKYSYWAPELDVNHEAHVECVEIGTHTIVINNGPGYTIAHIHCPDGKVIQGPGVVKVQIKSDRNDLTVFIDVEVNLN
jgi:hypothetical protein